MHKDGLIESWIPEPIRKLKVYAVADSSGMTKLDAMESPFQLDENLKTHWLEALADASINRYPDPNASKLKQTIREKLEIPDSAEIVIGNGSDELIQIIAILLGGQNRTFIAPDPSFSMYRQICLATSTQFEGIALGDSFELDIQLVLESIRKHQPACVFLAYPNNPTGNCFRRQDIIDILDHAPGMVVVDEAYHAFCGESFLEEIKNYDNLVVLRTLSKSGFAGLRLGILAAAPHWTAQIEKLRLPYNINVLTQLSAHFLLKHFQVFQAQSELIRINRKEMLDALVVLKGVTVYPSQTNFLLFHTALGADFVYEKLKSGNILIKNLHRSSPALSNFLRVTVGSEDESMQFIKAMQAIHQT